MPLAPFVTIATLTHGTKWAGPKKLSRAYGQQITTRATLFQLTGELHVFGHETARTLNKAPHVAWTIQPTGLRGTVEGCDAAAIARARLECDEAAREFAEAILYSLNAKTKRKR